MMRPAPGVFAVAMLLAVSLNAAVETRRFKNDEDKYAITLTADWKEVDATNAPYAKQVLSVDEDHIRRAYQLTSETNFAAVAFVEIDNESQSRVDEPELANLQVEMIRKTFVSVILEMQGWQVLDSSYETNRQVLRYSATRDLARAGKIRLLGLIRFTEQGTLTVSCVAPVEHFKAVSATFNKALDTFHIDPALAYRPRAIAARVAAAKDAQDAKDLASAADGPRRVRVHVGFIFGAVGIVLYIIRRVAGRVTTDEV